MYKGSINNDQGFIDISGLPKGVYFISISLMDKTETRKIIFI